MLITVKELQKFWNIRPSGVLHVGAHLAEESTEYSKYKWGNVIWIEAQHNLVNSLRVSLDPSINTIFEAVIWDKDGEIKHFGVASNSQSSSLLEFNTHSTSYPDIKMIGYHEIKTVRLDTLLKSQSIGNFINLDIQGAELNAIKSLGTRLREIDYIYTEVNNREVYENCTIVDELDAYLCEFGFDRKAVRWYMREGWGDALYVRNSIKLKRSLHKRVRFYLNSFLFYSHDYFRYIYRKIKTH